MEEVPPVFPVAKLNITLEIMDDGKEQLFVTAEHEDISVVTLLGMLEFAKDHVMAWRQDQEEPDD